jgi:glycine cleavage system regulatory protein
VATLTLTCIGDDRPGLVSALSGAVKAHDGSWERSQMARLAGKFAGILQVSVPDDQAEALAAHLAALDDLGLHVLVERTDEPDEHQSVRLDLELLGADHPGIVAEISASLASRGIGIEELSTGLREAPMAGGLLFEAHAVLEAPPGTGAESLRAMLESLADELMVDISVSETTPTAG